MVREVAVELEVHRDNLKLWESCQHCRNREPSHAVRDIDNDL